jgi:hypothetical protein
VSGLTADGLETLSNNRDEESSGIIAVDDILGEGWYLLDVQAHYNPGDAELVEGANSSLCTSHPARRRNSLLRATQRGMGGACHRGLRLFLQARDALNPRVHRCRTPRFHACDPCLP